MAGLPIWEQVAHVYGVAPTARLLQAIRHMQSRTRMLGGRRSRLRPVLRAFELVF